MLQRRIREATPRKMVFDAPDDVRELNRLKNIIQYEVPTLAIDQVIVSKNNTTLSNEILAHRIMMIPIASQQASRFKMVTECDLTIMPDVDPSCGSYLTLSVRNPPENQDYRLVTSYDLIPDSSDDPQPIGETFEIMPLRPGEELQLICIVRKGTGQLDVKFSPVSISIFGPNTSPLSGAGSQRSQDLSTWKRQGLWPWTFEFESRGPLTAHEIYRQAERIFLGKNYPCNTTRS